VRINSNYANETRINLFRADISVSEWVFVRNGASKYSSTYWISRIGFTDGFNGEE